MDQPGRHPGTSRATPDARSADPVTAAQPTDEVEAVLAGRDPLATDEAIGAHDGSDAAGRSGWSTSQGAGSDVATDASGGRSSTAEDFDAGPTPTAGDAAMQRPAPPTAEGRGGLAGEAAGTDPAGTPDGPIAAALADQVVALLDLPRWTEHLRALPGWRDGDRASAMLLRQPPVRVLLSALRQDAELGSDGAQETVMLLVVSGDATIEWRGEVARIGQGELAVVPFGGGWRIISGSPETVLLSTFWGTPGTAQADVTAGEAEG